MLQKTHRNNERRQGLLLMGSSIMKKSVLGRSAIGDASRIEEPGGEIVVEEVHDRSRSAFGESVEEKVMKYEHDKKLNIDPINYYGFGVVSYFQLLKMMSLIFLVLTLVHGPLMYLYSSQFSNYHTESKAAFTKVTSMGNMGFS